MAGLDYLDSICRKSFQVVIPPFEEVVGNYTDADVARVRRLRQDEWDAAATFAEPVIASDEFFGLAFNTLVCVPRFVHSQTIEI